jgi:hypothetical protein
MDIIDIVRDEVIADESDVQDYVDVLNGIVKFCHQNGFKRGWRNTIIVDLAVGAWMLGLDPEETLDRLVRAGVINVGLDDEDTYVRMNRVTQYTDRFEWSWMIDPEVFADLVREAGTAGPVLFRCE